MGTRKMKRNNTTADNSEKSDNSESRLVSSILNQPNTVVWPCHTVAYESNVRAAYEIFTHTLTYARSKLGIGCIRFKHGGIRWYTLVYAGIR